MAILIIRLHPDDSVSAEDFTRYLLPDSSDPSTALSIKAYELSVDDPTDGALLGEANYIAPISLPESPSGDPTPELNSNTRITQHFNIEQVGPFWARNMFSVATAVIEFDFPTEEYVSIDIRLEISRGDSEITHKQKYYNVPLNKDPLPVKPDPDDPTETVVDPNRFPDLTPVGLNLALPAQPPKGQEQNASVTLPEDGTAPNFEQLYNAVKTVLEDELGSENAATARITELTSREARHIAHEIIWGNAEVTLPESDLEQIYTDPDDQDESNERKKFEGELLTYYVTKNSEADRLTNFVYSLSAAIWCEQESKDAEKAGFIFPVLLDEPDRRSKVNLGLTGVPGLFTVPAEYFYVLSNTL
ncbi:MAG: hypothetical protein D3924_12450, partial [Candidatus Electrothrix sp. AR4]|nr:hypothetical protein [Candidatus Electrothrix sp. AR4]